MILTLEIVGHQSGLPGFSGSKQFGPNGGTIGRLPDNDWVLPDPYISGRHALIRYVGGKFYIEDISTNGVFLNAPDNRLQRSRPQLLEEGDRLYIDEYEIGVRLIDEAPAEPPPQVQVQQRPFAPAASTVAMPVMQPQAAPQPPQPAPVARPQPRPQPQPPQAQPQRMAVPPAAMQIPPPAQMVQPPPSVEPIMVARPSAPVPPPPPARPASRRVAAPDNDPLRLLGLDDRRQSPPAPAPVARVPDLLEMGRPTAVSPPVPIDPRTVDLMGTSSQGFASPSDASINPFPPPGIDQQDDLSLAPIREALSVPPAQSSLPPPGVPKVEPMPSMGANANNGYRPQVGTPSSTKSPSGKLGAMNGPAELARKASNGAADARLAYPSATAQNSAAPKAGLGSSIIPDDYDPLEDDLGTNAAGDAVEDLPVQASQPVQPPPASSGYTNGRMTMAQPPAAPPRRPAVAPPVPTAAKPEMSPPLPRANSPVPRMPPPPPIMASPQPVVPPVAPQSATMALQPPPPPPVIAPAKTTPSPAAQPEMIAAPPPPPSIPVPMPGPVMRTAAPAGVTNRLTNGVTPRTEEVSRPMIPPPAVPRPTRPAVVPYPGRKPSVPVGANGAAVSQAQPAAVPVSTTVSATPAARPQAVATPESSTDSGALAALLEAAGLEATEVSAEFSSNLGKILRVAVTGMIEVLRAQQSIKDEFRMRMTAFKNVDNNPLKLSGTPEEALQSLFASDNGNQSRPVEAFEEAFREVRNHELAMLDGMRVAYEFMLSEFDPDRVQEDFNSSSGRSSILGKSAKSRYWDFYREKYGEIISDGEASFRNRFGDEFAKAYEEQLERLNALDRNRGK